MKEKSSIILIFLFFYFLYTVTDFVFSPKVLGPPSSYDFFIFLFNITIFFISLISLSILFIKIKTHKLSQKTISKFRTPIFIFLLISISFFLQRFNREIFINTKYFISKNSINSVIKKIELYRMENSTYPTSLTQLNSYTFIDSLIINIYKVKYYSDDNYSSVKLIYPRYYSCHLTRTFSDNGDEHQQNAITKYCTAILNLN